MKPPRTTWLIVSPWIAVAALIAGTVDAGTVVEFRAYLLRERRQYDAGPPRRRLLARKAREWRIGPRLSRNFEVHHFSCGM